MWDRLGTDIFKTLRWFQCATKTKTIEKGAAGHIERYWMEGIKIWNKGHGKLQLGLEFEKYFVITETGTVRWIYLAIPGTRFHLPQYPYEEGMGVE